MRKRRLEMILEGVRGFSSPDPGMEQYFTPPAVAARLLYQAYLNGDLGGVVFDLGCGTGVLAIGAALLGAPWVVGFDRDLGALRIARENSRRLSVDVDFVACNIWDVSGKAGVVVMNPPFGAQVRFGDRPFLRKALEVADVVYSIHNAGSYSFVKSFISPAVITWRCEVSFPLKRTFMFHKKDIVHIKVEIYRIEKRD